MSSPSRRTLPSPWAFGIVSCIRFRHRMSVDLPHPDGPMIAVTSWSAKSIVMSWIARFAPYQADSPLTSIFTTMVPSLAHRPQVDNHAGRDADQQHDQHEDEGRTPCGLVLRVGRTEGERVDRVREGLDGLVEAREPEQAPEGGHEEGGGLSRHARNAEQRPRQQAAPSGGQHDP